MHKHLYYQFKVFKMMKQQPFFSKVVKVILTIVLLFYTGLVDSKACADPGNIAIIPYSTGPVGAPRTPVFNPFFAWKEDNTIWLGCSTSYGDVDVELVSTAGDYYQTVFDTDDDMILIPISGENGYYTLTLFTEFGIPFIGEFYL